MLSIFNSCCVKVVTLLCVFSLSACSLFFEHYPEVCKTHAYTKTQLADHISSRFNSGAPVRLGIVPLSVPENVAAYDVEKPGLGNKLAWNIHAALIEEGTVPIVEVLNRQDWPGKKEEFFTGNFGAIAIAREAGYDMVMVGYLAPQTAFDSMTVYTKLIETESGLTLWYGKSSVDSYRPEIHSVRSGLFLEEKEPVHGYISYSAMIDRMGSCIVEGMTKEE